MSTPVAIPARHQRTTSGSASLGLAHARSPNSSRSPNARSPGAAHSLSRSPVTSTTIEYASTAPQASSAHPEGKDEEVPAHLYEKLPKQYLEKGKNGVDVPDYLRMILMCEWSCLQCTKVLLRGDGGISGGHRVAADLRSLRSCCVIWSDARCSAFPSRYLCKSLRNTATAPLRDLWCAASAFATFSNENVLFCWPSRKYLPCRLAVITLGISATRNTTLHFQDTISAVEFELMKANIQPRSTRPL